MPPSILDLFIGLFDDPSQKFAELRVMLFFDVFMVDHKGRVKLKSFRVDLHVEVVAELQFRIRSEKGL